MRTTHGLSARVAAEVRAEQARQRLSGRDLARRVELPTSTVARWLRAETPMDLDDVQLLAHALGVSVTTLLTRAEQAAAIAQPAATGTDGANSEIACSRKLPGQGLELVAWADDLADELAGELAGGASGRRHLTLVPAAPDGAGDEDADAEIGAVTADLAVRRSA